MMMTTEMVETFINPLRTKSFCNFSRNLMTSGLASGKFKIIITLRRAQKFGDLGPYKNFDFMYNPLRTKGFCNFSRNLAYF